MSITLTGPAIPLYRLLALRQGIRLEGKGLRIGHLNMTALVRKELKLHLRAPRAKVLAALEAVIEAQAALARMTPGCIDARKEA